MMDQSGQSNEAKKDEEATETRRPYQKPRLRHLGSIRELTLGQTMGPQQDGGIGMMPLM
jgi:hypothetical protein